MCGGGRVTWQQVRPKPYGLPLSLQTSLFACSEKSSHNGTSQAHTHAHVKREQTAKYEKRIMYQGRKTDWESWVTWHS